MAIERIKGDEDKGELARLMRTKGKHSDGGGLYLQVAKEGQASWVFRYKDRQTQKDRWPCIGPASVYKIGEARDKAREVRKAVQEGRDPFQMLRAGRTEPAGKTFADALSQYIKVKEPTWKPTSRARERRDHERTFAEIPDFTALLVKDIDQGAKSNALAKLGPSARRKAKSWIGAVIRFAETGEIRERGGSDEVEHHAAMPYSKVPGFYTRLSEVGTADARALQWTILTGARTDEVIGGKYKAPATWGEIVEMDGLLTWVISADRMKATKVHRVPITPQMVSLLGERQADDVPLFEVSNSNAMLNTLKKLDDGDYTVHGFRSSFEDWAAETTDFPRDLVKLCTAHDKRTKVDKAYQRSDLLAKRREIMQAWSDYVSG
jgi:integrase